jgi:hypothetical protein
MFISENVEYEAFFGYEGVSVSGNPDFRRHFDAP